MKDGRDSFLHEVANQIHSKEAKKYVSEELSFHLKEAKKALMKKGLTEEEAETKAVGQMGSPIQLGKQLNKLHRPKVDWWMVILLVTTLILGFLPLFPLNYMEDNHFSTFKTVFVLLGGVAAFGLMLLDYRKWQKHGWLFYLIGVLILLVISIFGRTFINGHLNLTIGSITIENKMAIPFLLVGWSFFFNNNRLKVWHFIFLFLFSVSLFFNNFSISSVYLYSIMVFVMLWWSKFSRKAVQMMTLLTVSFVTFAGLYLWSVAQPYQKQRLLAFLNPEKYSREGSFTILKIKELLTNAGWFGNTKHMFIPEAHTNLVFVSFTYSYGWLFAVALVVILSLFMARIIVVIRKIKDSHGKLLLIGAVTLYGAQLLSNIGMTLGFFPLTTMPLPFISYGLMPTLLNAVLIGIVLSVYRRKDLIRSC